MARREPVQDGEKEVRLVKKWFVLGSAAAVTAVCVALLTSKDDVRRSWRKRNKK